MSGLDGLIQWVLVDNYRKMLSAAPNEQWRAKAKKDVLTFAQLERDRKVPPRTTEQVVIRYAKIFHQAKLDPMYLDMLEASAR